jgi:CRISPR-associated protein (TIGR02584 family)
MTIFLATLGQRPEAITMALDILDARFHYDKVGILHTDPQRSGIKDALAELTQVLEIDYPQHEIIFHELRQLDNSPLIDITNTLSAEAYYKGMVGLLRGYRMQYQPIHLLVASGRKAMTVYATLAATLLFGEHDRVWTVLAEQDLMQEALFHAPIGEAERVTVLEMPLPISKLIPGEIARQSVEQLTQRTSPRQQFLEALTPSELSLAEFLTQHPYASHEDLGKLLQKSPKTVENQFGSIYNKLFTSFDLVIDDKYKRLVLLDVMAGRV